MDITNSSRKALSTRRCIETVETPALASSSMPSESTEHQKVH